MAGRLLTLTFSLALGAAMTATSHAADVTPFHHDNDWYVGVFGGGVFSHPSTGIVDGEVGTMNFEDGFIVGGVAGTNLLPGLRGELELAYQNFGDGSATFGNSESNLPIVGDVHVFTALLNVWKDFELAGGLTPYVGAGVGIGLADVDLVYGSTPINPLQESADGTDIAPVAQVGAGVRLAIGDGLSLDLGYRFRAMFDAVIESAPNPLSNGGDFLDINFYTHSVQAGVNYHLGGPAIEPAAGSDESDLYFSLFGGALLMHPKGIINDDETYPVFDWSTGFTVGAAAGTELVPGLRGEAEVSFMRTEPEGRNGASGQTRTDMDGHVSQVMFLLNMWKDIPLGSFTPYIGGGLGIGIVNADIDAIDGNDGGNETRAGLAGQFGAGVRFSAADNVAVDLGYRYKGTLRVLHLDRPGGEEGSLGTYTGHILQAGVTYHTGDRRIEPVYASGPQNWYLGVFGGGVFGAETGIPNDDLVDHRFETGFTAGLVAGTHIVPGLRGELELSYLRADADKSRSGDPDNLFIDESGHHQQFTAMANLWKDFDVSSGVSPYLGGGLGISVVDVDMTTTEGNGGEQQQLSDTQPGFAFQAGAGVRMAVGDGMSLDVGYRYRAVMDILMRNSGNPAFDQSNGAGGTIEAHVVQAGISMDMN